MADLTLCVGATGAQGGSVARSLLARGWPVRALTRRPDGEEAAQLRALGAQVVAGDLGDLNTLTGAMRGCARVFGVTNYWEHFGSEIAHGKNLVDAAAQADVRHLVLSTLPSAEALSRGAVAVPHLDAKAAIESYARNSGVGATFVHVAFYFENFMSWFVPRPDADGVLWLSFPQGETPLAGVAVDNLGPVVAALFAQDPQAPAATVGVVGDELKVADYARLLSDALAREVRYAHVDAAVYAERPEPGARDLAAMFDLNRRFILSRAADLALTRGLHPEALTFAAWAQRHAARLRAVCAASDLTVVG